MKEYKKNVLQFPMSKVGINLTALFEILLITAIMFFSWTMIGPIAIAMTWGYLTSIKKIVNRAEVLMNPEGITIREYSYGSSEYDSDRSETFKWKMISHIDVNLQGSRTYPYGTMTIHLKYPYTKRIIDGEQIFDIRKNIPFSKYNNRLKTSLEECCKIHHVTLYWHKDRWIFGLM